MVANLQRLIAEHGPDTEVIISVEGGFRKIEKVSAVHGSMVFAPDTAAEKTHHITRKIIVRLGAPVVSLDQ